MISAIELSSSTAKTAYVKQTATFEKFDTDVVLKVVVNCTE